MSALSSGRRGLSASQVGRVKRLIDAGWPKTRIATEEGLHRATIHKIANGTHGDFRREPQPRCPGCGAKVLTFPCLLCQQVGRPCEPEKKAELATQVLAQVLRHHPFKEPTMTQLAEQLRKKAAELESRAAALREEAEREEAKASQLTQSADILASEPNTPAPKKAAPKPPAKPA